MPIISGASLRQYDNAIWGDGSMASDGSVGSVSTLDDAQTGVESRGVKRKRGKALKLNVPIMKDTLQDEVSVGDTTECASNTDNFLHNDAQGTPISQETSPIPASGSLISFFNPKLIYPESRYEDRAKLKARDQLEVLTMFLDQEDREYNVTDADPINDDLYSCFDLFDFTFYLPEDSLAKVEGGPGEMVGLQYLGLNGIRSLRLDGYLCNGKAMYRLLDEEFGLLSVGNYCEPAEHSLGEDIWIKTRTAEHFYDRDIWYRLKQPSRHYARFHEPFLWIAEFGKHVIDYLDWHEKIYLSHFRSHFHAWICHHHKGQPAFDLWLQKHGATDFRRSVNAYAKYLDVQASNLDERRFCSHPFWREMFGGQLYQGSIKEQPQNPDTRTVVTPYVYKCFDQTPVKDLLNPIQPPDEVFTPSGQARDVHQFITNLHGPVQTGDVVCISYGDRGKWKDTAEHWFLYIHEVQETRGAPHVRLQWLYAPEHTICGHSQYPFPNELFLSDHCECRPNGEKRRIWWGLPTEYEKVRVAFYGGPGCDDADFFVRQFYDSGEHSFQSLEAKHFLCKCRQKPEAVRVFEAGDTVLARNSDHLASDGSPNCGRRQTASTTLLRPFILTESTLGKTRIGARVLKFRNKCYGDQNHPCNELVWTETFTTLVVASIARSCRIKFFTEDQRDNGEIPAPYSRRGAGDAFIITTKYDTLRSLQPLHPPYPADLNQGFGLDEPSFCRKYKALGIFCGGGNFDRGVEEGGCLEARWSVDIDRTALETCRINSKLGYAAFWLGSVDDFLRQAFSGRFHALIPKAGEVDVILAGSPCQGFSGMNRHKTSARSLKNISLIASVVAHVDFYRPKYLILENVLGLARYPHGQADKNLLSQVLSCLVGLGYQIQVFNLDACSYGSFQARSRIFITATAQGLMPMEFPPITHTQANDFNRKLGKAANGEAWGQRKGQDDELYQPVFEHVTLRQGWHDLPSLIDGKSIHVAHPDHRVSVLPSFPLRPLLTLIPRGLRRADFQGARRRGLIPRACFDSKPIFWKATKFNDPQSRAFGRLSWSELVPTVMTTCQPQDMFLGRQLHPEEDRPLSVLEARRAQGIPDHEVIVGNAVQQWKIVGNSVQRDVAMALGLSLRKAWLHNHGCYRDNPVGRDIATHALAQALRNNINHRQQSELSGRPSSRSLVQEAIVFQPHENSRAACPRRTVENVLPLKESSREESKSPSPPFDVVETILDGSETASNTGKGAAELGTLSHPIEIEDADDSPAASVWIDELA